MGTETLNSFMKICICTRVLVPRIMAIIDRMIDVQLAFGYDVGKVTLRNIITLEI